jgi:hypothetical protein
MSRVFVPRSLYGLTGEQAVVSAAGRNVGELIDDLDRRFPGVKSQLCQGGRLRPGLSVVVNGRVGSLNLLEPLPVDAEVHFLPALGGG